MTLESIGKALEDFISTQNDHNKKVMDIVYTIKRGLYGDEANLVQGLMERQLDDEKRIRSLELFRNKLIWMSAGAILALEAVIKGVTWWVSQL